MKHTDARLTDTEKELLKSLLNHTILEFIHNDFDMTSSSYLNVLLTTEDDIFEVHFEIAVLDYFGAPEDIAVVSIQKVEQSEVTSGLVGRKLIHDKVNKELKNIIIAEDTQTYIENGISEQAFSFVSAIIFDFDTTKIMLTFFDVFSESINVFRGPYVEKQLPEAIDDIPEEDRVSFRATREVYSLLS